MKTILISLAAVLAFAAPAAFVAGLASFPVPVSAGPLFTRFVAVLVLLTMIGDYAAPRTLTRRSANALTRKAAHALAA